MTLGGATSNGTEGTSPSKTPTARTSQTFTAQVGNSIFAEDYQVSFEVGRSVDLFNRFGFLQLSFKVLPGVYAGKPEYIFIERSFPVFTPESRVIKLYKTPNALEGELGNATGSTPDPSKVNNQQ